MGIDRLKRSLAEAGRLLANLDFGELKNHLQRQRRIKAGHRKARRELKHQRDDRFDRLHRWLDGGHDPDSHAIKVLEQQIKWDDARIGELHSVISRAVERIGELAPKVRRKAKRKAHLLQRVRKLRSKIAHYQQQAQNTSGIGTFDGKPVAAWIIPILQHARATGWLGVLVSGYRTPEYSQQLCYAICGAPSCSGTCAGLSSRHTRYEKPDGAVDVSSPETFRTRCAPLKNALPNDLVHFSYYGN